MNVPSRMVKETGTARDNQKKLGAIPLKMDITK
jgi:hypothetical protein